VPFQRRLGFGIQPALAVLAGNALVAATSVLSARRASALRLGVAGVAVSGTLLVLVSVVGSLLHNQPLAVYRSTTDLDAAAVWLDARAAPADVVLADWGVSNYLAPRTQARVFGGHPVATLHASNKELAVAMLFAHGNSLLVARQYGVQWVVYGPAEASLANPPVEAAFQSGDVRIYHVGS
jgi:hypothetical protein